MNTQPKKTVNKNQTNDSLIEQLRDVGRGVAQNVTQDLFSGVASDALSSLFGSPAPKGGDMQPGEEVNFNQTPSPQEAPWQPPEFPFRRPQREAYRSPFSNEQLALIQQKEAEVSHKIEEIRMELKALIAVLRSVDNQVRQAVNEETVDPGIYHLNLDRLKTILKLMRKSLADSSSWLAIMRSRKKEKRYWNQYKKKGTTFGLSNERVVSTQVG